MPAFKRKTNGGNKKVSTRLATLWWEGEALCEFCPPRIPMEIAWMSECCKKKPCVWFMGTVTHKVYMATTKHWCFSNNAHLMYVSDFSKSDYCRVYDITVVFFRVFFNGRNPRQEFHGIAEPWKNVFFFRCETKGLQNTPDHYLGGGFKYFYFHPYLGKWSNLTNIFQMGWNHQLDYVRNLKFDSWKEASLNQSAVFHEMI